MTTIETVFIHASTGKTMAQADMPVERLPQSFAQETTLHLGDEDWKVIKAEPMTIEECIQTGKLVLTLQKVVKIPIENILFSLPTISDEIPKLLSGSTKKGKNVLELHEDDWRQIEFISLAYRSAINFELAKIRGVYQEASVNTGSILAFKTLHVRQRISTPLSEAILLDQFAHLFTSALDRYEGISYQGMDGLVDGGFAFRIAATLFYGQHIEGRIKILGVKKGGEKAPAENNAIAQALQRFMATYNLCLIDWCKLQLITANGEAIGKFLEDSFQGPED